MTLQEGNLLFDFSDAISVFKFDEQDKNQPNFHGLSHCMKAVDFIAEYDGYYLFVEIKDPRDPSRYGSESEKNDLITSLVNKFRDSFIYRWSENKLDKPIHYQCLVELDNAETLYLMNKLKQQLPTVKIPTRWQQNIADMCAVVNQVTWNKTFSNIQVTRV